MSELTQYNPMKVVGAWKTPGGQVDFLDGAASAEFAVIARDNPMWTREFDAYGNVTRVKNNNTGCTITITLSASSPTNDVLTKLVLADRATENIVGPISLKDLSGTTEIVATGCFLEDVPDVSFAQERGTRTWVFQCAALSTMFVGGHKLA
jgi:hypothetical protein